jgi:DNA-binding MarR family transcriptional regulator
MTDYVSYALAVANRKAHLSLSERLKKHGIQIEAWRIMELLDDGQKRTMGQLAQLGLINPPTLSKLVDRMVANGLVHRHVDPMDQRQINLLLTDLGRKRMMQIRAEVKEGDRALSARLGKKHTRELIRLLSEISGPDE